MLCKAEALFRRQADRGSFPGGQLVVRRLGEEFVENLAVTITVTNRT